MKSRVTVAVWVIMALSATGALAAGIPKVPTHTGTLSRNDLAAQPGSIVYTGDGSGFLAGPRRSADRTDPLSWSSWTHTSAQGSGFNWLNSCRPSCAHGTFHSYPVNLKLGHPKTVSGHLLFTRMSVTYTGTLPPHVSQRNQVWKVTHHGRVFGWSFPTQ